ncbi:hypothetical protein Godav_023672 [Gossypium davidsonii]|uniref:Aminotransferase-like plant mobile domain-containing protein n=1 Tax=Gossypium davidsonii TaxID=34287 RepID=A0A7J8SSK1_GOSDV|nr:hypothetical protein [Gossypium davidsonii]
MLGGTKLDPALISALVERRRLEIHTFHLLCGECKITLKDVALQLSLLVDGPVVTRVVGVGDWSTICGQLLGNVLNKFFGSWIKIKWLEENFNYIDNSASVVEKEQYTQAFILRREAIQLWVNFVDDIVPRDVSGDAITKN